MTCRSRCRQMVWISFQVKGWSVTGLRWLTRAARLGVRNEQHDAEPARGSGLGSRRLCGNLRIVLTHFCIPELGAAPYFHSLCCRPILRWQRWQTHAASLFSTSEASKAGPALELFQSQKQPHAHAKSKSCKGNHWSSIIIKHVHEGPLSLRASLLCLRFAAISALSVALSLSLGNEADVCYHPSETKARVENNDDSGVHCRSSERLHAKLEWETELGETENGAKMMSTRGLLLNKIKNTGW